MSRVQKAGLLQNRLVDRVGDHCRGDATAGPGGGLADAVDDDRRVAWVGNAGARRLLPCHRYHGKTVIRGRYVRHCDVIRRVDDAGFYVNVQAVSQTGQSQRILNHRKPALTGVVRF